MGQATVARGGLSASQLGTYAVIGAGYFVGIVALLHVIESEFEPADYYISDYATGDFGVLMRSAFFGAGLAALCLARGLSMSLEPGRRVGLSSILLYVIGVAFLFAGTFNGNVADEAGEIGYTTPGIIHLIAGLTVFILLTVVAFVLRGVFARDTRWQASKRIALIFAIALLIGFLWGGVTPEDEPVGIPQRVFTAAAMGFLAFVGWRLRELGAVPDSRGAA